MLPGGPLLISWPEKDGSVFMTGPAEPVFDGVLVPELVPATGGAAPVQASPSQQAPAAPKGPAAASFDCATDCKDGCRQPEQCLRSAAQQQVQSLLDSMSLDAMIDLASDSLEQRTRSRIEKSLGD
jgi:diaminopimelate epimerase